MTAPDLVQLNQYGGGGVLRGSSGFILGSRFDGGLVNSRPCGGGLWSGVHAWSRHNGRLQYLVRGTQRLTLRWFN